MGTDHATNAEVSHVTVTHFSYYTMTYLPHEQQQCELVAPNETNTEDDYKNFYVVAQIATGLFFYPIFCLFGLLGNVLSIVVLSEKRMTSSTTSYLVTMAVSDSIKLLNDLAYFIVSVLLRLHPSAGQITYAYLYPYAHYFSHFAVAVTSLLIVCVTAERYVIICRRTTCNARHKATCNATQAKFISTGIFVGVGILMLPLAFRYRTACVYNTVTNVTYPDALVTSFWRDNDFKTAFIYFHNIAFLIGPLCILCVLNSFIIRTLRRSRVRSRRLALRRRVTVMLVTVTLVFMFCITPDAIMSAVFGLGYTDSNYLVRGIREITDLLLNFNASVNFFLYCAFHHAFRDRLHSFIQCVNRLRPSWSPRPSPSNKPLTSFATSINGRSGCVMMAEHVV